MKTCHAAALALIGWYLMLPPTDGRVVYPAAPLADWINVGSYDSAKDCETALSSDIGKALQIKEHPAVFDDAFHGKCIATDDPRLKDK
jgi:hypothetical protein